MLSTHAVGIDLGTTYSCIAYLNEHGEPVSIPNRDGEMSTPSVVMFDGDHVVVGSEAQRNSIRMPRNVVMHAKRYMGDANHRFEVAGRQYTPIDISTYILKQLLADATERIGPIDRAVITVPAQFSDIQRQATAEAGRRAGLKHVDIINEPVAAALCFVLGTEGIWFTELASAQTIMVVDLGGGTFDLSLVQYEPNAVSVKASGGDLHLGGIDWNAALEKAISRQFHKEFGVDVLRDRESRQALAIEVEQAKRSLSVRPRAALTCQHAGQRKTYQVEIEQFERISKSLVERMQDLTLGLLKDNKMGWAHVDVVLTTGGASRMPMVRSLLKTLSGRTLNTSLSPDQSIAHGATYYAGMLLTNSGFAKSILNEAAAARLRQFKQQSANARALGILVRDAKTGSRVPHYLLAANTRLPAEARQTVGTVIANQKRAHLSIVESGTAADQQYVQLGDCIVEPLPENLPEGSEIEVTIHYDDQARVHVSAKVLATGQEAHTEIVRPENLLVSTISESDAKEDVAMTGESRPSAKPVFSPVSVASTQIPDTEFESETPPSSNAPSSKTPAANAPAPKAAAAPLTPPPKSSPPSEPKSPPVREAAARQPAVPKTSPAKPAVKPSSLAEELEDLDGPIPLCNDCGEVLDQRGRCRKCAAKAPTSRPTAAGPAKSPSGSTAQPARRRRPADESPAPKPKPTGSRPATPPPKPQPKKDDPFGEDEFYRMVMDDK